MNRVRIETALGHSDIIFVYQPEDVVMGLALALVTEVNANQVPCSGKAMRDRDSALMLEMTLHPAPV